MNTLKQAVLPICLSVAVTACGGGGGGSSGTPAPTADAQLSSHAFEIGTDTQVTLDGSGSRASSGELGTWRWSVESAPEYSQAQPADAASVRTGFVPDVPGQYTLCLTVSDGAKTSSPDCETLQVTSVLPVAVLSDEVIILVGQQYQLDGSRSLPPTDGTPLLLTYQWSLDSAPEGSTARLDDPRYVMPRLQPDQAGIYEVSLIVGYEDRASERTRMRLIANTTNGLPVADAGDRISTWVLGETVTLDGRRSHDPDNDPLQYRWGFGTRPTAASTTGVPLQSQAVLEGWDTPTPSFVPDMIGTYTLWLQVYDGTSLSTSSVTVEVDQLPEGHVNNRPVAFISAPFGMSYEIELGSTQTLTSVYSWDVESKPYSPGVHSFGRKWRLLSHPAGFDPEQDVTISHHADADLSDMTITFSRAGDYVVELQVFDGELWSDPATQTFTVLTGANRPPRAVPGITGAGTTVGVGQTITLDGEGSTDPDHNRLTYQWTLLQKPDDSQAALKQPTSAFPTLTTDVAGPYLFELTVTDSHGLRSDPARLQILAKSRNNAPVARPTSRYNRFDALQPLLIYPAEPVDPATWINAGLPGYNSVNLVSDAYDPDGDSLTYLWSLQNPGDEHRFTWATLHGQPDAFMSGTCYNGYTLSANGPYTTPTELHDALMGLRDWTCTDLNLAPATPGTYRIMLLVSDGIDTAGPYEFSIPAVHREDYPTLLLEQTGVISAGDYSQVQERPIHARQYTFPHLFQAWAAFPVWDHRLKADQDYPLRTYQLTAFDQDYTIENLETVSEGISAEHGYRLRFEGLTEGQVIPQGETVEFSVRLLTSDSVRGYDGGFPKPNLGEGLRAAFQIRERAGWTFTYLPYIYPSL